MESGAKRAKKLREISEKATKNKVQTRRAIFRWKVGCREIYGVRRSLTCALQDATNMILVSRMPACAL